MANQSPDRRQVMEMLAKVSILGQFPGFSRWVCAAEHAMSSSAQNRPAEYHPQFFTPVEYAIVDQVTGLIIPADSSPGAKEAAVAEFIDFMTASDPEIQGPFRDGVRSLDERAQQKNQQEFLKLSESEQINLLQSMTADPFFKLIREYTVMGYYTSRIGLGELDDPGLKLYSHSPACPHKGDPEHKRLPPPRA
jgi:hypothetical protein